MILLSEHQQKYVLLDSFTQGQTNNSLVALTVLRLCSRLCVSELVGVSKAITGGK